MKYFFTGLLHLILFCNGFSQTILNGDFESNSASPCDFNLDNSIYSIKMSNSWGFGLANELDIQSNTCGFALAPSNNWFVCLSSNNNGNDELSLKLSSNLITGNTYQISYFDCSIDTFEVSNVELQIGLSTDSLNFGDLIYTSLPDFNSWKQRIFTFNAPNNGLYLTVRNDNLGNLRAWNFIDHFQLNAVTGINENILLNTTNIVPNPTTGKFNISLPSNVQNIEIYNSIGQLIKTIEVFEQKNINLELDELGFYFVKISSAQNSITKKIVVNK